MSLCFRGRGQALFGAAVILSAAALSGCGSATGPTPAAHRTARRTAVHDASAAVLPAAVPISHGSRKPATRRFLVEVNTVCNAVRGAAPRPLKPPYAANRVMKYATLAQAPTRRTMVSLQRLAATDDGTALDEVADAYVQVQLAYQSSQLLLHNPHAAAAVGSTILLREQIATADSRASGIPACGVAGL
jgi:hypothetical protein